MGTTTIEATAAAVPPSFGKTSISYTLRVGKKPVKVKVKDVEKDYGATMPAFDYWVIGENEDESTANGDSGLEPGDNKNSVAMQLSTEARHDSHVGRYAITGVFQYSDKYEVKKIVGGTLTVQKSQESIIDYKAETNIARNTVQDVSYDVQPAFGIYRIGSLKLAENFPEDPNGLIDGAVRIEGSRIVFRTHAVESGEAKIKLIASFPNYEDGDVTITVRVGDKKSPDISGILVENKIYDGKPATYSGEVLVNGKPAGSREIKWFQDYGLREIEAAVRPGNYVLRITTKETEHHSAGTLDLKFLILPRELIVKPRDITVVEGKPVPNFELDFLGLVEGEALGLNENNPAFSPKFEIRTMQGRKVEPSNLGAGTYRIVLKNAQDLKSYLSQHPGKADNGNYDSRNMAIREGVLSVQVNQGSGEGQSGNHGNQNQGNTGNQAGESSSGGEQGSSDGSSDVSMDRRSKAGGEAVEKTVVTTNGDKPTATLTAHVKEKDKVLSASISDEGIKQAVSLVEKTAKNSMSPVLEILLADEKLKASEGLSVHISQKSMKILSKSRLDALVLNAAAGGIALDKEALISVSKQGGAQGVEISVTRANEKLSEEHKDALGDAPVFDVVVQSERGHIKTFDGGHITVRLPYALKEGELPNRLVIRHIDEEGRMEEVESQYDAAKKEVIFRTDHLSRFAIVYEPWMNSYEDIRESDWYYSAVKFVGERDLMSGAKGLFYPTEMTSRAMLVTILHRMEHEPKAAESGAFEDVQDGAYYAQAVNWAHEKSIVSGYGNGAFGPHDLLTREQVAQIIRNYAQYKGVNTRNAADLSGFRDLTSVSEWALPALQWAYAEGIVSGKQDHLLDPQGYATRAELAVILMRWMRNDAQQSAR